MDHTDTNKWINKCKFFCVCFFNRKPNYKCSQNNGVGKSQVGNHHSKTNSSKNTKGSKN